MPRGRTPSDGQLLGNRIILGCGSKLAGHVVIEDDAIINGMTGVIQFVRIGRHAFIGGVNKVTRDILPFMIADGSPAMMRVVNVIGLKRKGFDDARIARIKRIIRGLFKDGATALSEAVEALAEAYPDDADVECLRRFVADSRVGIARLGKS
jgi:UDP-N-acetylglucosamine acyltransferase